MKQTKFSLADLLTVLGTLGFGFFCYLSFNFYTLGDTFKSILYSLTIALTLGGLAFTVKLLKSTSRNFKSRIIVEGILLFFFIIISLISIIPFSQFFAVSERKTDIQQKVINNINHAETLFSEYERYADTRLNLYKAQLNSVVNGKLGNPELYESLGFVNGNNEVTQLNDKVFSWKAKIFPSNYMEMKRVDSTWLVDAKDKMITWSPLGIVTVVNTLNLEIPIWRDQLISNSTFRAPGEKYDNDFEFQITFDDVTGNFNQILKPTFLSIFIAISLYLIMLLSYFITKRHTRFPGFKVTFGSSSVKNNEL
jgi:hypothetical protein